MMWPLLMTLGCTATDLSFVMVAPDDLTVERAYARLIRYTLTDCGGDKKREWVGRRLDLRSATPDAIPDREWCTIDLEFKDPLLGPPMRWVGETSSGSDFDIALSPGTVTIEQAFGGTGEDLAVLVDLADLMTASEIDLAAAETGEDVEHLEDSEWSQQRAGQLAGAIRVVTMQEAARYTGWADITIGPTEDTSGCARRDTATYWGRDSGWLPADTAEPADTGPLDPPSSGGCSCAPSHDTGPDTDTGTGSDSGEKDDEDEDEGGGCGGEDTGSGSDTSGLMVLLGLVWFGRRRDQRRRR